MCRITGYRAYAERHHDLLESSHEIQPTAFVKEKASASTALIGIDHEHRAADLDLEAFRRRRGTACCSKLAIMPARIIRSTLYQPQRPRYSVIIIKHSLAANFERTWSTELRKIGLETLAPRNSRAPFQDS